ncbi:hypothetical protein GF322_00465 [Candidatus Dependentiae bacterium]|nr:hypothetical protein [Candidatus Dependentiae bacterium]
MSVLINELELYYADALYEKRLNFNRKEKVEILKVIEGIQNIIEKYKKEYL